MSGQHSREGVHEGTHVYTCKTISASPDPVMVSLYLECEACHGAFCEVPGLRRQHAQGDEYDAWDLIIAWLSMDNSLPTTPISKKQRHGRYL